MYVKVLVRPGVKKEEVVQEEAALLRISVREPAERNLANARVRELVARVYKLPLASVRLISGHRSRSKIFSLAD